MRRPSPAPAARPSARPAGFTLVEVLLVLAILGVIAAMVVPNLLGSQERANVNITRTGISDYEGVIRKYAIDHNGRPPQGSAEQVNQLLMNPEPVDGRTIQPYIDKQPRDGWGEVLFYQFPPKHQTINTNADIWSAGPNGQNEDGSGDDINNWADLGT